MTATLPKTFHRMSTTMSTPGFVQSDTLPLEFRQTKRKGWSCLRSKLADIIFDAKTDRLVGAWVLLQFVFVIQQTDIEASQKQVPVWLHVVGVAYLLVYSVDLSVRLFVWRSAFTSSSMNVLDAVIVLVDWVALLMDLIYDGNMPNVSILRIARAARIGRAGRMLSQFRELYFMVHALRFAMKAAGWAIMVLSIVLTVWAIIAVQVLNPLMADLADSNAFGDCDHCKHSFSTIMQANLTFFETMVVGDDWGKIAIPLILRHPGTAVLFCGVFVCVNLGLLNLILSAIVDATMEAREHDLQYKFQMKSEIFKRSVADLLEVCKQMDSDGNGLVTRDEVKDGFDTNVEFRDIVESMDAGKEDLDVLFDVLDKNNIGAISHAEFVSQLHKMKTQDSHTLLVFMRCHLNQVRRDLEENLRVLKEDVMSTISFDHELLTTLDRKIDFSLGGSETVKDSEKQTDTNTSHQFVALAKAYRAQRGSGSYSTVSSSGMELASNSTRSHSKAFRAQRGFESGSTIKMQGTELLDNSARLDEHATNNAAFALVNL